MDSSSTLKKMSIADVRKMIDFYKAIFKQYGMTTSGANALIRLAAYQAARTWSDIFVPMRFDPSYAMRLGYTATPDYVDFKKRNQGRGIEMPQPWPFVLTGRSKQNILGKQFAITVVENGGKGYVKIRVPLGGIAFKKADVFTRVLPGEQKRFLEQLEINLRKSIIPRLRANFYPRDFKFTADQRGVRTDERSIINEQRRFG